MNAKTHSISNTRNSSELMKIRKDMLNNVWPEACIRCRREEESQLRSRRSYEGEIWSSVLDESAARALTDSEGRIPEKAVPMRFLDVRFGNKCNLKCRMCGPTDSDLWYQDQGDIWGPHFEDTHGRVELAKVDGKWVDPNGTYNWYSDNENFWKELEDIGDSIKKINIVGGEPLLIDQHYKFLETLVRANAARHVTLEYNTNLTILPQKALDLWRSFKSVRIGVSLDGYGANNSYIRFPSKWEILVKNMKRLAEAEGPFEIWMSATIQILNAFEITDLIRWKLLESDLKKFNSSKRLPIVTSHALHKPDFLSLKALPMSVKKDVEDHYMTFAEEMSSWAETPHVIACKNLLNGYLKFMNSADESSFFPKFKKYTQALDQQRGDALSQGSPRLWQSLTKHGLF